MPRRKTHDAFTLTELLVIIVILVIVAAIWLPASTTSREAARRSACSSNLKQLGIALHNYHETFGCFPPASTGPPNVPGANGDTKTSGDRHGHVYSWHTLIIPFMGSGSGSPINFLSPTFSPRPVGTVSNVSVYNHETAATPITMYECPSYAGERTSAAVEYGPSGVDFPNIALTNYVGVAGVDMAHMYRDAAAFDGEPSDEARLSGMFPYQRPVATASPPVTRLGDIRDGASNTLMMVETREQLYAAWWDGSTAAVVTFLRLKYQNAKPGSVKIDPGSSLVALNRGGGETDMGQPGKKFWYLQADEAAATFGGPLEGDWSWGPSSDHPGGAQHLMGDASVQFIVDNVDPVVYHALTTIAGGEPEGINTP